MQTYEHKPDTREKTIDDETPDKTPELNLTLTAQQVHILYWIGCEYNEDEKSTKLYRILDKFHHVLKNIDWEKETCVGKR